jgi:hypothetical protein
VGVSERSLLDQVRIFPNPASNTVSIFSPLENIMSIKLMDLSGKLLYAGTLTPGVQKLDLSRFASGTYLVELEYDGYSKTNKLQKH